MTVKEARERGIKPGTRIRVTAVSEDYAERVGFVNDKQRLLGAVGTVPDPVADDSGGLYVDWDEQQPDRASAISERHPDGTVSLPDPGRLKLAPRDEIQVL